MQQADYHRHQPTPWMQESVSMHKSHNPLRQSRMNQARSEEEEKERKRDRGGPPIPQATERDLLPPREHYR